MRYLMRIVAIVTSLLVMALAVCSGEDRSGPGFDQALECSELSAAAVEPVESRWGEASACAGESTSVRFKALVNGTVVRCEPGAKVAAIWQNANLAELAPGKAEEHCAKLCEDPEAPADPTRCSTFCKGGTAECDPVLTGLTWRLPLTTEMMSLSLQINDNECAIEGCRMDPTFAGGCDYYWAAELEDPEDPGNSARAFLDMRGGGSGFEHADLEHPVRCVADRT